MLSFRKLLIVLQLFKICLTALNPLNKNNSHNEELRLASKNGDDKVVRLLLEKGADVRDLDDEALRFASCFGHDKVVCLLLGKGADVSANSVKPLAAAAAAKLAAAAAAVEEAAGLGAG